jgi:predicted ferric reductase
MTPQPRMWQSFRSTAGSMDDVVSADDPLTILRLFLRSSESLVDALANTGGVPQNGHVKKLIEAVLWHRKFILTYYLWIAAVVAISCGLETYKRRGNRKSSAILSAVKDDGVPETSPSSSSSSTLTGSNTPPHKHSGLNIDEASPLLSKEHISAKMRPSLWHRLRYFLLWQPAPIPALTSPSNTVPDNGTSILVLSFLGLNLFYLLYRAPLAFQWIFILVDRAGLLFVANLPVLYILAAKNNQPIKYLTGWSYEGLNIFHRRLGEWMTGFAVIHMCGMTLVWYTLLRPLGWTFLRYLTTQVVFLGLCAVLSYYIIYATSVGWFRYLYYEAFLGLHIFFQCAALVFLFFHYPTARPYVAVSLAIWIVDRGIWRIAISSRKFIATLEVAPDGETVLVYVDVPLRTQKSALGVRPHLQYGWAPGQHVFLTIPVMGTAYRFQAHPFTIASPAPPRESRLQPESWPLQLTIRAINGFSRDLLHYAKFHQHCEVILEGPHGSTSVLEAARAADRICLVAGGSGIAVTYPLAWNLRVVDDHDEGTIHSTRTVYANGVKTSPIQHDSRSPLVSPTKYSHFWVRQDNRHEKWITMLPKASATRQEFLQDTMRAHSEAEVASLVTTAFDTRSPGPEGGRPDMKSEIWDWVTSTESDASTSTPSPSSSLFEAPVTKADGLKGLRDQSICVIVSGPDGLVRDVRNICAQLVLEGWPVDVHVEKFGW